MNKWIECAVGMPKDHNDVLVFVKGQNDIVMAYYNKSRSDWCISYDCREYLSVCGDGCIDSDLSDYEITHWMPLPKKPIKESTAVGIDVGLKHFATLSNGTKIENPKFLFHSLKRLRIEQRTLQRRYKKGVKYNEQSNGYKKQRLVVAKLYEKIAFQRKDFLHKLSTDIINSHDSICVENLNIAGMVKNKNLSRSILDVAWSEFIRQLKYKIDWNGKNLLQIGRFEPSSKLCTCGELNNDLTLADRVWTCKKCGAAHDRDELAANNIKTFGLRAKPLSVNVRH